MSFYFFFFNDTATTEIYTLSLHDALPIFDHHLAVLGDLLPQVHRGDAGERGLAVPAHRGAVLAEQLLETVQDDVAARSEEHTSELQSRQYLVCRLLLEKKKK